MRPIHWDRSVKTPTEAKCIGVPGDSVGQTADLNNHRYCAIITLLRGRVTLPTFRSLWERRRAAVTALDGKGVDL